MDKVITNLNQLCTFHYFSLQITIENPDPWDKPREGRPPIFHRNGRVEIIPNDQGAFLDISGWKKHMKSMGKSRKWIGFS